MALVEVKIFLRAIVGEVRSVKSNSEKEWSIPFPSQLIDCPLDTHTVSELVLALVWDRAELHEAAVALGRSGCAMISSVWSRVREGDLIRPGIHRIPCFPLPLGADMEVVPATQVDSTRGMMEELAGSHGAVSGDLEAFL